MYWITKSGQKIKIRDMDNQHLMNAINLLLKLNKHMIWYGGAGSLAEDMWCDSTPNPIFEALEKEARKRGLL